MSIKDVKYIYIDTETSGVDPYRHGITQLAGEIIINGVIQDDFNLRPRLFPADEWEEEALEKQSVTYGNVMERPMNPQDAHSAFVEILKRYVDPYAKSDKFFFIGYNAKFDWDMLHRLFEKCEDVYCGSWFWWPPLCVATLLMNRLCLTPGKRAVFEDFTLGTIAKKLNLEVKESELHSANYDIHLTRLIHEKVCAVPPAKPPLVAEGGWLGES